MTRSRFRPTPAVAAARRGAMLPLAAVLIVFVIGLLAFAIDLGYVSLVRHQLQHAADASALAAASQLLDRGQLAGRNAQAQASAAASAEAARFADLHRAGGVAPAVGGGDVACGYLAYPRDPRSAFDQNARPANSARVTLRRDRSRNGEVGLFFGPIFGHGSQGTAASATATYEGNIKGFTFGGRADTTTPERCLLLPFAADVAVWDAAIAGAGADDWSYDPKTQVYRGGRDGIREVNLYGGTKTAPGNFGTVDIGNSNNAVGDIRRQILSGPSPADFAATGGRFELGPGGTLVVEGDPGLSAGFKSALEQVRGQRRIIPLYRGPVTGSGNNTRYTIVRFAGCVILDVDLTGPNKRVVVQPEHVVDPMAVGGGPIAPNSFVWKPLQISR